tara:strand:- start:414 stop:1289 length:876 start_codon:yes stop_codon:yes gene_type:complete
MDKQIPKSVIIVPYRNRESELSLFKIYLQHVLKDINYKLLVIEQCKYEHFNVGCMRNIGFLMVKKLWPNNYHNMNLVFHDVDNIVAEKYFSPDYFTTISGEIKHIIHNKFGRHIGGAHTVKGSDFEKTNGYPNFWGWGEEDNVYGYRVLKNNIKVNRYFDIYDCQGKEIILFNDNKNLLAIRNFNLKNGVRMNMITSGLNTISNLDYSNKETNTNVLHYLINDFKVKIKEEYVEKKVISCLGPSNDNKWFQFCYNNRKLIEHVISENQNKFNKNQLKYLGLLNKTNKSFML